MLAEPLIHRLRLRMTEIYGRSWTSVHGEGASGGSADTWAKGLAGLTPEQLAIGLDACILSGSDYPPSLPMFRRLAFGIPTLDQVRAQINNRNNAFVRMIWQHMDVWRFTRGDNREAESIIRSAYTLAVEQRMAGVPLPAESDQVEHRRAPVKPASPQVAEASLANLREMLKQPESDEGEGS